MFEGVCGGPVVLDHEKGDDERGRAGLAEDAVHVQASAWRLERGGDKRHRRREVPETQQSKYLELVLTQECSLQSRLERCGQLRH